MLACAREGFEGYRAFAPPGWEPPDEFGPDRAERLAGEIAGGTAFCRVAEADGTLAGALVIVPGVRPSRDGTVPDAHLRQLFVLEPYWGSGIATALHDAGREALRGICRLYTPAGQLRARRFYEREGWTLHGEPFFEDRLGLDLVEYRLTGRSM
jgi:GNAT superfamily N-acetyltransferase